MHFKTNIKKVGGLRFATKVLASVALFVIAFSPLLLSIESANAQEVIRRAAPASLPISPPQLTPAQADIINTFNVLEGPTVPAATLPAPLQGPTQTPRNPDGSVVKLDQQTPAQQAALAGRGTAKPEDKFCDIASTCITSVVYVFTAGIAGLFAYISAYFFNIAVSLALSSTSYSIDFITQGWTTVRDIANMAFIFIIIYIAMVIIFRAETATTLKTLAAVILMALLINFSFFITRVVVDGGNIIAVELYNAIPAPLLAQTSASGGAGSTGASVVQGVSSAIGGSGKAGDSKDLTAYIMNAVKIQTMLSNDSFKAYTKANTGVGGFLTNVIVQVLVYVAVGFLFVALGITFLSAGVKFLSRIIILWFVIIASPLAFAARAIGGQSPSAKKLYDQWQGTLINYSLYPAVFLFIFIIISKFTVALGGQDGLTGAIFSDLTGSGKVGSESFLIGLASAIANVAIRVGIVILMFYYSMKLTDILTTHGSSWANGLSDKVSSAVSSRTKRVGGYAFSQTASRLAGGAGTALGKTRFGNMRFGGNLLRTGFEKVAGAKLGGVKKSFVDRQTADKARKTKYEALVRDVLNKNAVDKIPKDLVEANIALDAGAGELRRRAEAFTLRDLESLGAERVAKLASFARDDTDAIFNQRRMTAIQRSEKFTDAEKEKIYTARSLAINPPPPHHGADSGATGGGGAGGGAGQSRMAEIDTARRVEEIGREEYEAGARRERDRVASDSPRPTPSQSSQPAQTTHPAPVQLVEVMMPATAPPTSPPSKTPEQTTPIRGSVTPTIEIELGPESKKLLQNAANETRIAGEKTGKLIDVVRNNIRSQAGTPQRKGPPRGGRQENSGGNET